LTHTVADAHGWHSNITHKPNPQPSLSSLTDAKGFTIESKQAPNLFSFEANPRIVKKGNGSMRETGQTRSWYLKCLIGFLPILLTLPAGCGPSKKLTVASTAILLEDVAKSAYRQSDLQIIRQGMPAYLMLIDGMVVSWPQNQRLLLAAAQAHASYASAFTDDDDQDFADMLYAKARDYALGALALRGLSDIRRMPFETFETAVQKTDDDDIPYLFWAAACWGNWIGLNLDNMTALAELPRVELMMRQVLALDETYYYGGPHLFMGIWYASRPKIAGGNLPAAERHFGRAIEIGEGKFLMAKVYYAEYYAKRIFDASLYTQILQEVLETRADIEPDLTLINTVAHQKARTMLKHAKEFF
jgi:hypothetical protein